jgi:hypothetical protein
MNASDPAGDLERLRDRLAPRLAPAAREWLTAKLSEVAADPRALAPAFAAAGRRTGRGPLLDPQPASPERLRGDRGPILNPWRIEDAARVALLIGDAGREARETPARAADLYFHGELRERIGVLRALQCLPRSDDGVQMIRDALRTNAADLFAAAICENLYAEHLPDDVFRQAVIKCLFVGCRLDRIEGIEERATPELSRMLLAYVTEREHAGRAIAVELWPILALHPPEGTAERVRGRLAHVTDPYERHVLEIALARCERVWSGE